MSKILTSNIGAAKVLITIMVLVLMVVGVTVSFADPFSNGQWGTVKKEQLTPTADLVLGGTNRSTADGNAVAALSSVYTGGWSSSYSCYSHVTNVSGVAVSNTASWTLQGSPDGTVWVDLDNISITASEIDAIVNTSGHAWAAYFRANVTAVQNANAYTEIVCAARE
jgi:hypothetical protein